MATLRNVSTGLVRQAGLTEIAATVGAAQDDTDLLIALLRLETAT